MFANIEARDATGPGIVQVGPANLDVSNYPAAMNYGGDGAYTTGVTIKLDSAGKARLKNGDTGTAVNLRLDIQGYFSGDPTQGGSFTPLPPATLYSTTMASETHLGGGEEREIAIAGRGGLPGAEDDAPSQAAVVTVTARNWASSGQITLWNPEDEETPATTNVSFIGTSGSPASGVSSSAVVELSSEGTIAVRNSSSNPVDIAVTGYGWFSVVDDVQELTEEEDEALDAQEEAWVAGEGEDALTLQEAAAAAEASDEGVSATRDGDPAEPNPGSVSTMGWEDPASATKGNWQFSKYDAKTWGACDTRRLASQTDKKVRAFRRSWYGGIGGAPKMRTNTVALRCGAPNRKYGYHHITRPKDGGRRLSHAEEFELLAGGRNWRDFADWMIYWTLKHPDRVVWQQNRQTWCFRGPVYFKTGKNSYATEWGYVAVGKTGRRLITAYISSDPYQCNGVVIGGTGR